VREAEGTLRGGGSGVETGSEGKDMADAGGGWGRNGMEECRSCVNYA